MQAVHHGGLVCFPASPPTPHPLTSLAAASCPEWNVTFLLQRKPELRSCPEEALKSGGMGGKEDSDVLEINIGGSGPLWGSLGG